MSESNSKEGLSAGAWIAIGLGVLLVGALLLGCLGVFLFGVRTTSVAMPPPPASAPASAPAPTAPSPAPAAEQPAEQPEEQR